jgi:ubiquitin-protein ligase
MPDSPRIRRLRSDLAALQQLAAESSVFDFTAYGTPPDFYVLRFRGRGVWLPEPAQAVSIRDEHEVHVRLGAAYPRMMPELAWKSPIFHPNISTSGVVCLGGYGTYWVPSLALDNLCDMLWDMIRYANFDEKSPYNREAAAWAMSQTSLCLPLDKRPLRDRLTETNATEVDRQRKPSIAQPSHFASPRPLAAVEQPIRRVEAVVLANVIEAELVPCDSAIDSGILFIE